MLLSTLPVKFNFGKPGSDLSQLSHHSHPTHHVDKQPIRCFRTVFASIVVAMTLWSTQVASAWQVEGPAKQATLVELFTSEGCSSCPPADQWLSQLQNHPKLFDEIVPIAYHVTYWNYLGWSDPYGYDSHNKRHRKTARLANSGVYTPGVFVQGQEWRSWRYGRSILNDSNEQGPDVGTISAKSSDERRVYVVFQPNLAMDINKPSISIGFLRMDQSTDVRSGENAGRKLSHDFIVGEVTTSILKKKGTTWVADIPLEQPSNAQAVALWVTDKNGEYIQAAATRI